MENLNALLYTYQPGVLGFALGYSLGYCAGIGHELTEPLWNAIRAGIGSNITEAAAKTKAVIDGWAF